MCFAIIVFKKNHFVVLFKSIVKSKEKAKKMKTKGKLRIFSVYEC